MEHHPVADLFPMLPEDELKDLAADIAERGLLQPIVLDKDGRILDGRNRYAACELASVEPEFETYDGDDPDGYALAVNIARRHLTKGQIAMVTARALRNNSALSQRGMARSAGTDEKYVRSAFTVLDFASDLADSVVGGTMPLNDAYKTAQERKRQVESDESKMAKLREADPDLAVLVDNDYRELSEALAEAENRKIVREVDAVRDEDGAPAPSFEQRVENDSITWAEAATLAQQWQQERSESIQRDRERIHNVAAGWGTVRAAADQPDNSYVRDVLDGLGVPDQDKLKQIISELKGVEQ